MGLLKQEILNIPDFGLDEKFQSDIWDIMEWDFYKNAGDRNGMQCKWRQRSSSTNNKFDISSIANPNLKEEIKYAYSVFVAKMTIGTFAEKYDYLKHIIRFLNKTNYSSITDNGVIDEFTKYFLKETNNKLYTDNGKQINASTMTIVPVKKKNRCITCFQTCIQTVKDFYEKDIPEVEKDIWRVDKLPFNNLYSNGKLLHFDDINNPEFKQQFKDFALHKLNSNAFDTVCIQISCLKTFLLWMTETELHINHFNELNRQMMEDYFCWLRIEKDFSQNKVNNCILNLKVFFELGRLLEFDNFPEIDLITTRDYAFKTKKDSQYFTDKELNSIISVIPKMNKLYGKIVYILIFTGLRINELLHLPITALKQHEDKTWYLDIKQRKTKKEYDKPIPDNVAKILLSEIEKNKAKYGEDLKFIFVKPKKNEPISYQVLCDHINQTMINENVLDRNGNPLRCNTHRFRATYATNLFKTGNDPESTGKLLGQTSLGSLAHYVVIVKKDVKEQLKPRLDKDEILISNIGKIDDKIISDYKDKQPLCNGWCSRSFAIGTCPKANACLSCNLFIPSIKFLTEYELQLKEVEAAILIAKENNMETLLQKNLKLKDDLIVIIEKVKQKMEVQNG